MIYYYLCVIGVDTTNAITADLTAARIDQVVIVCLTYEKLFSTTIQANSCNKGLRYVDKALNSSSATGKLKIFADLLLFRGVIACWRFQRRRVCPISY